ncbi:DNA-directed RNA polymerase subunit beta [Entomoplasma freundtii]|uniref:DNA-directed RNA polymerase subunit beta n=2 Tax=Entomoplasma freundtii TaxID=74700 RepID=A0A2K8NS53_9MOLU|nr:DNA-directed RNA polymerase subunit beta [Entomoplasma freundtii]ATZ16682.1 DNA-directed RNA polymerase subunit beta [Entomoplasma freundtii]TDY58151.1 DNA-directed RNA polymerase subunit beta [Entomoplasma freundtii]
MSYKIKKVNRGVERRDYTKYSSKLPLPNLVEIQTNTFKWFQKEGIQEVFNEVFPILSNDGTAVLTLENWEFRQPRTSIATAKSESKIYEAPIYANLKLAVSSHEEIPKILNEVPFTDPKQLITEWLKERTENKGIVFKQSSGSSYFFELKVKGSTVPDSIQVDVLEDKDSMLLVNVAIYKTGEVFLGEFPLMTDAGTFIINGSQKVIVSQLVRSPGAYFNRELNRKNGEIIYSVDIIPSRGTWLEFETETKKLADNKGHSLFYVKIDKSRKCTATSLLTTLGLHKDAILNLFDQAPLLANTYQQDNWTGNWQADWDNQVQEIYKKIRQGETATAEGASKYIYGLLFDKRKYDLTKAGRFKLQQKLTVANRLLGQTLAEDIVDVDGKVLVAKNTEVTRENFSHIQEILSKNVMLETIEFDSAIPGPNQVQKVHIYADKDNHKKILTLIGVPYGLTEECLTVPDILATMSYEISLMNNVGEIDDIDHLGNRRVRTVGELLQNQFRIGMMRIEKNVKEKLATSNLYKIKPSTIINNKPLTAIIGEFFNLSQLSQFMDQINPLSELTNKRRLTALGPGGLSRDRAGLEVRDVHPSHYGRICPIETPEGPNIGLINNLACYAQVNEHGFITTPYRKVTNGVIDNNDIHYLTASEEGNYIISQSSIKQDDDGKILEKNVVARYKGEDMIADVKDVDYIDVSPKQIVSIATSGIPFLENDDANRALMGANMQRQAVPLLNPESPIVGTGIEFEAARDSGAAIVAEENALVKYVDSNLITTESKEGIKTYTLASFERSNNGTALVHRPIVKVGDKIEKGQIIADGPSMDKGELAIGQNVVVAFTTYNGYNFEDAIIMSERVVMEDRFTSIHIDEYSIERRNTKQGAEDITRDVPNISEAAKKYLDADGIVAPGTEVKVGDILVGKVTPKGQAQLSPEDKLLHAIFGEKSRNVKDNSLRVPNGGEGIVQSIKRFSREDGFDLPADVLEVIKIYIVQKRKIQEGDKMSGRHGNKGVISRILPIEDMPHLEDGTPVDIMLNPQGVPSRMNIGQILEIHLGMAAKKLGVKVATPVFEGLNDKELNEIMTEAGMTNYGKVKLIDGQTGDVMDKPIAVGVMYMLKLSHMVDDKLHARNVGPYSLITQQPLGGKAQNGGQRFGEMEVWALEAYGAAHTLREILTIKSDDIKGRTKTYEAIVRSKEIPEPGIPESFNVLTKEIMGLGFDMYMEDDAGQKMAIKAYDDEESLDTNKNKLAYEDLQLGTTDEIINNLDADQGHKVDTTPLQIDGFGDDAESNDLYEDETNLSGEKEIEDGI